MRPAGRSTLPVGSVKSAAVIGLGQLNGLWRDVVLLERRR